MSRLALCIVRDNSLPVGEADATRPYSSGANQYIRKMGRKQSLLLTDVQKSRREIPHLVADDSASEVFSDLKPIC